MFNGEEYIPLPDDFGSFVYLNEAGPVIRGNLIIDTTLTSYIGTAKI